jgi:hypothetical protein
MLCNEGDCTAKFGACNNIFYIKNGYVIRHTPIGTDGARCFTDGRTSPRFTGPTNLLP